MTKALVTTNSKEIQQWQPTKNNSLMIYKELNEVIVGGSNINISTNHELCIIEDNNQLSSLIVKGDTLDKTNCYKLIELFVIEIFEWFGKDAKIDLIQSTAKTIYNNYYWLKISELKLFVEKIKGGTWQQIHNMSPAVLMERLADFASDSMNIREQFALSNNSFYSENIERESLRETNAQHTAHIRNLFNKELKNNKNSTNGN